jgi:amino acid transporter
MWSRLKRLIVGNPLASHRERHERLSIPIGLAVFASDALSSTAYATEEILLALVGNHFAGQAGLLSIPVAVAIVALMTIVVLSYRQVIIAHPTGGGSYEVAKEKLGVIPSQIAGSALLIDYVLTVAVSVSAGVAAITSTGVISGEHRVSVAILLVMFIMFLNLRGVKESGKAFAVPAYIFIASMVALLIKGFYAYFTGDIPSFPLMAHELQQTTQASAGFPAMDWIMGLALMNAFSHGCAALTGVEAVSNGIQAFKEPAEYNASKTMIWMGVILGTLFLGVTFLAYVFHIIPDPAGHETVISRVTAAVFGKGSFLYWTIQIVTMIILVLAANTSFSGFPRLGSILAQDGYLPRQLLNLGDRLVYSNGIIILGFLSVILIMLFHAETHAMIPLYAVGVFLSFTLAQSGMVVHHLQHKEKDWRNSLAINLVGSVTTGFVTLLLIYEKFWEGAWMVLLAMPIIIWIFREIHEHYRSVGKQLSLPPDGYCPLAIEHTVLVLVSSLNRGTIPALEYAKTISDRVEAVHVELNPAATERLQRAWDEWGCGITLTVLKSPYRSISEPLLEYIDEVEDRYEHDLVTIIVPEFVTKKGWHNLLHNQTSIMIKALLRYRTGKVVTTVRYHLDE